jgi:hypothetical protein
VPTLRPRSLGFDITAANGTSCWGTQLTMPRPKDAAISVPTPGEMAAAIAKQNANAI